MADNPVKSWIEERRAIHTAATDGPWVAEYSKETGDCVIPHDAQSTREAVAVTRLFHRAADAVAIADAHNTFPAALSAIEAVLELHKPEAFEDEYNMQSGFMCESCYDPDKNEWVEWPCPTVQAIEGVIDGE